MALARALRHRLSGIRKRFITPPMVHAARTMMHNRREGRPTLAGMQDPHFKARFVDVPASLEDWIKEHASLRDASILDFGCGEGVSALGLALGFGARRVVGVDIMPDPTRCAALAAQHLGLDSLPPCLALHQVPPGALHDSTERFDIAYSWSVFEHVDQGLVDPSLALLRSALRPGGLLFIQIEPLFYSAQGSHLAHVIAEPWAHLRMQDNQLQHAVETAVPDPVLASAYWSTYRTLNRITHRQLLARIRNAGFEVLRTFTSKLDLDPPGELLGVYHEEVLRTNQVVVLARRGP